MALLLTQAGRVELARSFHRDIKNANDYYHFVLGRTTAWADEDNPETPIDSVKYLNDFRNNLMFAQAVTTADICHLATRIDWVSGTIYDSYDDNYSSDNPSYTEATTLSDAKFYIITDELKVYKCIDNASNSASTVKPTSTSTSTFILSDNYTWKFMFQVSASDETKFLDSKYIPVRKLTGNPTHDVNGEIDSIDVASGEGGSGYTTAPTVIIDGDGTGASATATISAGEVTAVTIDSSGSGYSFAIISITGGGGSGAKATATLGDADSLPVLQSAVEGAAVAGTVDRIVLSDNGQDYSVGDVTVTISGDGTGAEASVTIAAGTGAITAVNITDEGSGYTHAEITFTQSSGVGTGAVARAILSPIDGHGSDPVRELFGKTIGITSSLADNDNKDLIIGNDFRQIGLAKNLYNYDKTAVWTNSTATSSFIIDVDSTSNYSEDDLLTTNDGGEFRVIQITDDGSGTFQIYLQPIIPLISDSSSITNTTKNVSGLSINSATDPEINVSTGEIVYIENRPAITRSDDQVETIKALVNF